jgi:hypothetical protein
MAAVRGKDFKLYRNTDDPYDNSPTFEEVENVRDLTRSKTKALADVSIRGSSYRMQLGTLKELSVEFQMVYDAEDIHYVALEDAFEDDSDLELLILDGSIETVGSRGIRFMAQVTDFTNNEALEDAGLTDVTVVPAYFPTNLPRRVHVVTPGSVEDLP